MNDRQALLKRLQVCDFVMQDVKLYLDSHPTDKTALGYYKKYNDMRKEALAEYVSKYGPVTSLDQEDTDSWKWVKGPWPWQNEED